MVYIYRDKAFFKTQVMLVYMVDIQRFGKGLTNWQLETEKKLFVKKKIPIFLSISLYY